ncbi:xanthine dehydrogenase family protein molybdopterin-binding subunit [Phyllobacterium endophyticum]|uniref:Xanthine dehydrogenase family protein molybdopterin-binding subunit n=1 Tax=Phyllobacterium endophyticum TaxID=1149773 RepID=A0A2P7AS61_9HYPH|nr:xanthine dehydrogenase family protein molybdopterin-binding subunit [Phyllobacterium endophyticum]MBB3236786.1 xanthine dehydrogenase YagR molybdenum-binding subunit [Phyllobacterium endophyticum]PSH57059.1 xanthine dehydrogenase family protein molybdopterin-binding subunit [Phyllobacterium endophyticum]TYR40339.1 xanthine dehydrogenase family protein molybdopterin-binding subunit [Phyllobacterium endophyticum]
MPSQVFPEIARVDARDKVLGQALYGADINLPGMLYAMLVPATIAKGRVGELDVRRATETAGVVQVLSIGDFPTLRPEISFLGQPIALVVAETIEAAIEGAEAVTAVYEASPFVALMSSPGAHRVPAEGFSTGDVESAFQNAATIVEGTFETPTQHHNPMELFGTVAEWSGGRLTVYEGCQNVDAVKGALAKALNLSPDAVAVKSEHVGGGFGQKSPPKIQTALVAQAARLTRRPVKLVAPRGQVFHIANYRPRSIHNMRLAANAAGRLDAISYDVVQENIPDGGFRSTGYHEDIARLYAIENFRATAADVHIDRQMPRHTRGTHPFPAGFALESLIDEMAHKLGKDPVQFRLDHQAKKDIIAGQPLSPHFLNDCLTEGAKRFGWSKRVPEPGSMRLDDGTLVGFGVACGIFGASMSASEATLRVRANGTTRMISSGHEMGQGMLTAIANVITQGLDINPDRLEIQLGDTTRGPQIATVGERGTASCIPVALKAVHALRAKFEELAGSNPPAGNLHEQLARLKRPYIEVTATELAPGQDPSALKAFRSGGRAGAGPDYPGFTSMSYIAQFVEIHIDPMTRRIRMPRAVSIADIGRVVSPRTAKGQMYGGVVWGFSTALREETEVDPRFAGYLNDDLADYVIAVNADIGNIDVGLIDQPDPRINSVGVKGMGELVMLGTAPAIANAIYHATGKRIRKLPIRIEDVL